MPLLYATGAAALTFTGFGRYSLDATLGLTALSSPSVMMIALAVGIIGGILNLTLARNAPATPTV